jgi:hypothetical protein
MPKILPHDLDLTRDDDPTMDFEKDQRPGAKNFQVNCDRQLSNGSTERP